MNPEQITELKSSLIDIKNGIEATKGGVATLEQAQKLTSDEVAKIRSDLDAVRRAQLAAKSVRRGLPAAKGRVSDDCARHLMARVLIEGEQIGFFEKHGYEGARKQRLVDQAREILGVTAKTAITTSDMPVPTDYAGEVAELVAQYGQARQYGTVYPLGALTTNLPRLKTSPSFGFIDASATVTEKSPQYEWVQFDAKKAGGLVRLPTEIDEDSIVSIGQFLARYGAREMAKWEDTTFFTADGSATYKTLKGVTKEVVDQSKVTTMASTKTHISDATLTNFRTMRTNVDTPALAVGAYYLHPSMEQHLATFNSSGDKPYMANGVQGASLDGFPIRWIDVLPPYSTGVDASKVFALFGDLSFWYLGLRAGFQTDISREVFFATDELAVRFLERFSIGMMATGAMGGLRTAAS